MQEKKNHKICLFSLDFSKNLSDDRYSKGSKSYFFHLKDIFDYALRTPLDIFKFKIDTIHIFCSIALFFLIVLVLQQRAC